MGVYEDGPSAQEMMDEPTFLINQPCLSCGALREEEYSRAEFLLALNPHHPATPEQHQRVRLLKEWCECPLCTECKPEE